MAAPHVAGAAAYLADLFNVRTSEEIETKVREYFRYTGFRDADGKDINIVQLP